MISLTITVVMSQECVIPERDLNNILLMNQKNDWTVSDCPCYHHQTTNFTCPQSSGRSSKVKVQGVPKKNTLKMSSFRGTPCSRN